MAYHVPRVQIVPQPDDQVAFHVEGVERLRWHFSPRYPRPFFFPIIGPSGRSVTRMGHPAAPDHDHHRSLWLGHQNIGGVNFWEERGGQQQIRQDGWIHYQDGDDEAAMAVKLGWHDAHKVCLLQQELIASLRPYPSGSLWLELQSTFSSPLNELPIGKTNFGFLGLRVAASMSAHFGGGKLTNSDGSVGEKEVFGKPARWMDFGGPIGPDQFDGVTWFDHPTNPKHPTSWHVRDDGWMSAAFCLREGYTLKKNESLRLRYGFHVHSGSVKAGSPETMMERFGKLGAWGIAQGKPPWRVLLRRSAS